MADAATGRTARAKTVLFVAAAIGVLVFIVVLTGSIRQTPGIFGVLKGIFLGLFSGLLVTAGGGWGAMSLMSDPQPAPPPDLAKADVLQQALAPVLTELEQTRLDVVAQVNARLPLRLGLGVAGGVLFWLMAQFGKDPATLFQLLEFGAFGGFLGYFWAVSRLSKQYRRLYKDRVLPLLAARFGALSYRDAVIPDLGLLRDEHVFPEYENIEADDEIYGTYRGLAISIVELKLTSQSGDDTRIEFQGLLASITLPRGLRGTTAIIADTGTFGGWRDWMAKHGRDRVRIEDPQFEASYDVYGTGPDRRPGAADAGLHGAFSRARPSPGLSKAAGIGPRQYVDDRTADLWPAQPVRAAELQAAGSQPRGAAVTER